MIMFEHNLRRHVAGSPRILSVILWLPHPGNTEVSQPEVAILIEDKILWLDVSMDNALNVNGLEGFDEACDKELGLFVRKLPNLGVVVAEITAHHEIHDEI